MCAMLMVLKDRVRFGMETKGRKRGNAWNVGRERSDATLRLPLP